MKVSKKKWNESLQNLIDRRTIASGSVTNNKSSNLSDYCSHLSKVNIGSSLLDVGCGSCTIQKCLSPDIKYLGIDPHPYSSDVISGMIEDTQFIETLGTWDTICAFAVLDGCQDLDLAISNMKRLSKKNIVILTGIGILPDKYHTFKIELEDIRSRFSDWKETVCYPLAPKVWLLEYSR